MGVMCESIYHGNTVYNDQWGTENHSFSFGLLRFVVTLFEVFVVRLLLATPVFP